MDSKQTPNNSETIKKWLTGDVYEKKEDQAPTADTPDEEGSDVKSNAGGRTRTADLRIMRPSL